MTTDSSVTIIMTACLLESLQEHDSDFDEVILGRDVVCSSVIGASQTINYYKTLEQYQKSPFQVLNSKYTV